MKRAVAVVLAAGLVASVASTPAVGSTPTGKRITTLERQVRALQAQVRTLKAQVTVIRKTVDTNHDEARSEAARNRVGDACMALAVADVFQATWANLDRRVAPSPAFGPQRALDDVSCKAIGVTRPGIENLPNVDVFWALTGWLIG